MEFEFAALPWHIIFGVDSLRKLPEELDRRGFARALVLCTPEQTAHADVVKALITTRWIDTFDQAVMHVPLATVESARHRAEICGADCTISIGGGSTTGLGKALALHAKIPNVAIPTTYAGSEMTNVWGLTDQGKKSTGRDVVVVPDFTIYDPRLTLDLPAAIAGPSGMNAMAQAVVNVMSDKPNPIVIALACDGIRALANSLPTIVTHPRDIAARTEALYGTCLAGAALGVGVVSLHHRLCHTLGGCFNTPHADTHAILLAHTVAYNAPAVPAGAQRVAEAMGVDDAAAGIFSLLQQVSSKTSLRDLGLKESELDIAATLATATPCDNPAEVTTDSVRALFGRAYHGHLDSS